MYKILTRWIRCNFGFTKTEVNGYLVLLALMVILHFGITRHTGYQGFGLKSLEISDSTFALVISGIDTISIKPKPMVPFDPNKIPYDSLVARGVLPWVARNIVKYRDAGGFFGTPNDLKRIYGLTDSMWMTLRPWVRLKMRELPDPNVKESPGNGAKQEIGLPQTTLQDINKADSAWLKTIYGIGPVLSKRIVKYRDLIGGFVSLGQLNEIYGLSPEVIDRLTDKVTLIVDNESIRKIDINQWTYHQFASHPYLSYSQARAIVSFREQHGIFEDVEELKNIHLIDDSTYLRVRPYLDF